jgi:hypothetical protein
MFPDDILNRRPAQLVAGPACSMTIANLLGGLRGKKKYY